MGNFLDVSIPESSQSLVVGLKGSGKSSILMKYEKWDADPDEAAIDAPDLNAPQAVVKYFELRATADLQICFTDISGDQSVREEWKNYADKYDYDSVIWVVDSTSDEDSLNESATALENLMANPRLKDKLLFVLASKQDDEEKSLPITEIAKKLRLDKYKKKFIFSVSARTGLGMKDAWNRLVKEVTRVVKRRIQ
jgi:GTPase SAR1 family protein